MKKVDVLFLYETKVRELENICLIKNELEDRGLTVGVANTWNEYGKKKHKYKAKVVVTHAMNNNGVYEFVLNCCGYAPKIVNMQCEQIGTMADIDSANSRFVTKEMSRQAMNLCWGEMTKKRLTKLSGIDEKHLYVTGHVALDFCRKELREYYRTREEIFNDYGLNGEYKTNLFISSFAYVNLPKQIQANSEITDKERFIKLSNESFDGVLEWFERLLNLDKKQAIIYRPHPAEAGSWKLKDLEERYGDRFRVIRELSVKQWIIVCDKVFAWYSTSAVEAYKCGVPCGILRPVDIGYDFEIETNKDAKFIETFDLFLQSVQGEIYGGIDGKVLSSYYHTENRFAFELVADAIEKTLNDDAYLIEYDLPSNKTSLKQKLKTFAFNTIRIIAKILPKASCLKKFRTSKDDEYTLKLKKQNYASEQEIEEIQQKLRIILKSNGNAWNE